MKTKLLKMSFIFLLLATCTPVIKDITKNPTSNTSSYIYLYLKKDVQLTIEENNNTNNEKLNEVISRNKIDRFHLSWPDARTESLKNIYEMHFKEFKGDTDQLIKEVEALDLFEKIEITQYYVAEGSSMEDKETVNGKKLNAWGCTNPVQTNDVRIVNNWSNNHALELLDGNCAWNITQGDPSIVIGIADTEFNLNHEDLKNQIIYTTGNNNNSSNCAHGSLVAGAAAAETNNLVGITGIGYKSKMAGYIVPTASNCSGNPWPQIWQAYLDGRRIINVSWTGVGSGGSIQTAIKEMTDCGTVLVLGAGNSPNVTFHSSYANIPGVINVSGVNSANLHDPTNHAHNQWVDVCALSINVSTTGATGTNSYPGGWGTSFAAPQVAGLAALILSINPCFSPADVETIIKSSTDPIVDANQFLNGLGTGRANAYKAVQLASKYGVYPPITSNTNWNTEKFVTGDLVVTQGNTLTITDKVRFAKDSKLIVEKGAKLNVSGGTLTNSSGCKDDFWGGIEVEGVENNPSIFVQGRVTLSNATIENAANGIVNYKSFTPNTNGGTIYASNSTFRNNGRSLAIHSYGTSVPRRGIFNKCNFVLDDNYCANPPTPFAMVTMWEVDRYIFNGCTFSDNRSNPSGLTRAIYSADAGYEIMPYNNIRSQFKGFDNAIQANNTGSNYSLIVDQADFESNNTAIRLEGVDGARLVNNNVQVGKTTSGVFAADVGFNLTSSKFFTIEKNDFVKGSNSNFFTIGLFIRNSGEFYNQVYTNNFNNLFIGNWANGQNNNIYAANPMFNCYDGLEYQCNFHNNTRYDIAITGNNVDEGIRRIQGSQNLAAGNQFSTSNNFYNIYNNGACDLYYFYNNQPPANIFGTVNLISVSTPNSCNPSIVMRQNKVVVNMLKTNFEKINQMREKNVLTSKTSNEKMVSDELFSLLEKNSKELRSAWINYLRDTTFSKREKDQRFTELLQSVGKPDWALYSQLSDLQPKETLSKIKELKSGKGFNELQLKELNRFTKLYKILDESEINDLIINKENEPLISQLKLFISKNKGLAGLRAKQILDRNGIETIDPIDKMTMKELEKLKEKKE